MAANSGEGIFISYRRDDAGGRAGRIFDRVSSEYGRERVFMDVDSIRPGTDFAEYIDSALAGCNVLLAVIGPGWLDARTGEGARRLEDPHDFVRLEVATALRRGIAVIPVLVNGASVPATERLPEDLRGLTRRAALRVDDDRWGYDSDRLVDALHGPLGGSADEPRRSRSPRRLVPLVTAAVFLSVIAVVTVVLISTLGSDDQSSTAGTDLAAASVEGRWDVNLTVTEVQGLEGFSSENRLWNFEGMPAVGLTSTDAWILGPCEGDPCKVKWTGTEVLDRFKDLTKDGATYQGYDDGTAKCVDGKSTVDRDLALGVTKATGGRATAMEGTLAIGWTCRGADFASTIHVVLTPAGS